MTALFNREVGWDKSLGLVFVLRGVRREAGAGLHERDKLAARAVDAVRRYGSIFRSSDKCNLHIRRPAVGIQDSLNIECTEKDCEIVFSLFQSQ